ncbi:MAG: hypothetical protein P8N76_22125 [Pirellulaceae bacterium]|nr:hypothetical protein [Pirellulaceae bacterium]
MLPGAILRLTLLTTLAFFLVGRWNGFELSLSAKAIDRQEAQESGASALRDSARFPWYEADQDRVRRVELRPYQPPRQSNEWESKSVAPSNVDWTTFWDVVQWVSWILLVILAAVLLYYFLKAFGVRLLGVKPQENHDSDPQRIADRIEKLPFSVDCPRGDFLSEARRLYQNGQYQEAIVYLFSYQLIKLDEFHFIRLSKGKTNRQYLVELRGRDQVRKMVSSTMLAFEDVFFGHYSLSKERFESCWEQLDEFHEIVRYESPPH